MRLFKTEKLKAEIEVRNITPNDTAKPIKMISVRVNGGEWTTVQLSEPLVKAQVTDNALVRHILNFFIKE